MALHLHLTGLFSDGNDSRLTIDQARACFPRAVAARSEHLADLPKWRELGHDRELLATCRDRARQVKAEMPVDNFVVLGIGGSALGNAAMLGALAPVFQASNPEPGQPKCFVLDTVDPDLLDEFFETVDLTKTHINVISKSGGTIETSSQFMLAYSLMLEACGGNATECAKHFTITTDPNGGHFRSICDEFGFAALPVPDGVGGRFSVLSPVGLFNSEMAGLDTESMLAGAAKVADNLKECDDEDDPALWYALMHILYLEQGLDKHVHFAYGHRLRLLADWYCQLWAESLGKRHNLAGEEVNVGPTPLKAVGPTDQHSQSQLFVEGPDDKVYTMLKINKFRRELSIPKAFVESAAFSHLEERNLSDLMEQERQGTEVALRENGRPVCVLEMCSLDAFHLGQYFMFMEIATAYAGGILGVNPYDQPGVESGKIAALSLMGCKGYEQRAAEIKQLFSQQHDFKLSC
ncbi:MAG: glucose-6-phosphate isomerase [Planctomycetes bacterium]|nr:glucose-6-phosphate isomerase [Planctomycetota bacterium]